MTDTSYHEAIARRAYELWEQEDCPDGREMAHWSRAEAQIGSGEPEPVGGGVPGDADTAAVPMSPEVMWTSAAPRTSRPVAAPRKRSL